MGLGPLNVPSYFHRDSSRKKEGKERKDLSSPLLAGAERSKGFITFLAAPSSGQQHPSAGGCSPGIPECFRNFKITESKHSPSSAKATTAPCPPVSHPRGFESPPGDPPVYPWQGAGLGLTLPFGAAGQPLLWVWGRTCSISVSAALAVPGPALESPRNCLWRNEGRDVSIPPGTGWGHWE